MADPLKIVVLEGDETGQELLDAALKVLDPEVIGLEIDLEHHDLSLEHRRETSNEVVEEAARAMKAAGFGIKAATITPEGRDDVGSPNRIVREGVGGKVIIRTGRRIPGVIGPVSGVYHPISVVRMAVEDAYGAKQWREGDEGADDEDAYGAKQWREGDEGADDEVAYRTEKVTRSTCRAVAEYAFREAERSDAKVYGGPKWTVSPVYEGMLKEEMDAAAERHPDVRYQPVLIDATYAGLMTGAAEDALVIPALNRDGDCLSDLVLPMFGSIAGAESVLLAFDEDHEVDVAMAEAPHGTAPSLLGKDLANPMAMLLACGAVLHYAGIKEHPGAERASRAIYESVLETVAGGVKTVDLGGHATTTEFGDAVVEKTRTKVDIWASLGNR
jgi:isocitrate dehydrogenase (NAD+)